MKSSIRQDKHLRGSTVENIVELLKEGIAQSEERYKRYRVSLKK
jgi:hypothetical protein